MMTSRKDPDKRQRIAKEIVVDWYNKNCSDPTDRDATVITKNDVYIVWFCKTLQNWKALLSTDIPDTRYYEVTFNGDKSDAYLDVYVKEDNEKINV
jgi:hypothetical protein